MIQIAVIDDERNAILNILSLLKKHPDVQVVGTAGSVQEGVQLIKEKQPQLLLLDIEMGDGTGFDLLEKVKDIPLQVIFITAYDAYAIKAIRYSVLDYLLKPMDPNELNLALERVKQLDNIKLNPQLVESLLKNYLEQPSQLLLSTGKQNTFVEINQIVRCMADDSYTQFYLSDGKRIVVSKNLGYYAELLEGSVFFRIHRSHLINLDFVKDYNRSTKTLWLKDGEALPISKYRLSAFLDLIKGR